MKTKLPKLASSLVAVARRDLMAVRRKKKTYKVDMGLWHLGTGADFSYGKQCVVCQAGAVMACTLGSDPAQSISPLIFDEATQEKLLALNILRNGAVDYFVRRLAYLSSGCPTVRRVVFRCIGGAEICVPGYVSYESDPTGYLAWLKRVEIGLRKLGI